MHTGCAILAAGASRRLGQPKQLVEIAGEPLVRRVAQLARETGCEHVGVVIGCQGPAVAAPVSCSTTLNGRRASPRRSARPRAGPTIAASKH
jgi:CTP:molybdopterin cytidylyltransferase MocA